MAQQECSLCHELGHKKSTCHLNKKSALLHLFDDCRMEIQAAIDMDHFKDLTGFGTVRSCLETPMHKEM